MANYIYRVQNAAGEGPYHGLGSRYWATSNHDDDDNHPLPLEDGIDIDPFEDLDDDHLFGFRTKKQLLDWFNQEELDNLAEFGYFIKRCVGEVVYDGYKQCIFIPK